MIRVFKHYIPRSFLLLGLVEFCIFYASVYVAIDLRFTGYSIESEVIYGSLVYRAIVFAFVMQGSMTAMGLYWRNLREGMDWRFLLRLTTGFLIGYVLLSIAFYTFPDLMIGRGVLGIALLVSYAGILFARYIYNIISDPEVMKRRVLILGAGKKAHQLDSLRRKSDWHGFHLIGYIHIPGEHDLVDKSKILSTSQSLMGIVEEYEVDEIIVAIDDRRKRFPVDEILECKMSGVNILDVTTFFERQTGKIRLETLHPSEMIFSDGFKHPVLSSYSKRAFDILVSLFLLSLAWPIMILTALSILIESRGKGSVLYRQERVGKGGVTFDVLKFRSMKIDAEKDGKPQWAKKNDSRVTKNGRVIRLLRIDELPQLFNVLKGEMSFVGPRPERPQFVEQLSRVIPYYNLRHRVNPGITGWAQISYSYGSTDKDAIEKLQYDLYYIKNYSLLFDFVIIFQTAHTVLWGSGAR
ncbi:MAG: TIGR03013 family PEP-CTERM/XrtA system glycosyltransferase [Gammaproteobacteria bacterium]|nr:TIGR03013 family PEP-CTERM/XrtA system glycosyltransferase [Gammaproteobacteria bacterium]MCK5092590.1 TIGR03013 family PEP-CTERM/XrtA system glycosyltransferase [Gammaproteobacteria bacterium]